MNAFEAYIQRTSELLAIFRENAATWAAVEAEMREVGFTDREIDRLHEAWDLGI